jgi:Flp pilus assembly protein TadG
MLRGDKRGTAALEFVLVAVPFFLLIFAIFDLGRYAITVQSLRALADAGARAQMLCANTPANVTDLVNRTWPAGCSGDPLSGTAKQDIAPFLYSGGLTPDALTTTKTNSSGGAPGGTVTITASESGFTMIMPIWGTALNAPSASVSIPF